MLREVGASSVRERVTGLGVVALRLLPLVEPYVVRVGVTERVELPPVRETPVERLLLEAEGRVALRVLLREEGAL